MATIIYYKCIRCGKEITQARPEKEKLPGINVCKCGGQLKRMWPNIIIGGSFNTRRK